MLINRHYQIEKHLDPNKVVVIYGPRRVGKTTLVNEYLKKTKLRYRSDSGENLEVQRILSSQDSLHFQIFTTIRTVAQLCFFQVLVNQSGFTYPTRPINHHDFIGV